jgi:translation initiation factor IF-1
MANGRFDSRYTGSLTVPRSQVCWKDINLLRSILSRADLIQLEGKVTRILGAGIMEVQCDNDIVVRGRLSGRMKKYRIKVLVGDQVQVSVSPYDPTHGLITYRMK